MAAPLSVKQLGRVRFPGSTQIRMYSTAVVHLLHTEQVSSSNLLTSTKFRDRRWAWVPSSRRLSTHWFNCEVWFVKTRSFETTPKGVTKTYNATLADVVIAPVWSTGEVGSIPTGCTKNYYTFCIVHNYALVDKLAKSLLSKGRVFSVRLRAGVPKMLDIKYDIKYN